MLDQFLYATIRKLAAVWRVLGSPRIPGDEKAVRSAQSAWAERERPVQYLGNLGTKTRNAVIGVSGLAFAIFAIWLIMSLFGGGGDDSEDLAEGVPTPTVITGPVIMTEVDALNLATVAAREAGLISEEFKHIARRVQFGEYALAIGEQSRADRGLLEAPSETEIWAIAFAGDVELALDSGERVAYDNLTVVLDAITGEVYRVEAFYGEYESEARAPVWLRPPTPTPEPRP